MLDPPGWPYTLEHLKRLDGNFSDRSSSPSIEREKAKNSFIYFWFSLNYIFFHPQTGLFQFPRCYGLVMLKVFTWGKHKSASHVGRTTAVLTGSVDTALQTAEALRLTAAVFLACGFQHPKLPRWSYSSMPMRTLGSEVVIGGSYGGQAFPVDET